jgi:uncharacterized membrane protein YfcA
MPGLEPFLAAYGGFAAAGAVLALAAGGFAKGVVGFALPLIALSLAGSFVPYEVAVALLIMPMLVSNLFQALRNGIGPAWGSLRRFWRLNLVLVVMIALAAQLVVALPDRLLFAILGVAVSAFGASQLAGWQPHFPTRHRATVEVAVAMIAGFFGGLSGIWGPPLIMYLLTLRLPKVEMVRAQSLSFLLGSVVLLVAHLHSGVLNRVTLPASAWLVLPTMAAMFAGYRVHDRLDQRRFLTATLAVLVLTGLNLLRRAMAA